MKPARDIKLKVMTINVCSGLDYNGIWKMGEFESPENREQRFLILTEQLREQDPDILAVQEANTLPAYARRLAKALGMVAIWRVGLAGVRAGPLGFPQNLREGTILLAKPHLGLKHAGARRLTGGYPGNFFSFHLSEAVGIMGARLNNGLFAFVTHWSSNDTRRFHPMVQKVGDAHRIGPAEHEELSSVMKEGQERRVRQSRRTLDFIKQVAKDSPFLLLGDLNAPPESPEIQALDQAGLSDVYRRANPHEPGFTWEPQANHSYFYLQDACGADQNELAKLADTHVATARRLDYIFAGPAAAVQSERLKIQSADVVLKAPTQGMHASDHYAVKAQIVFRGH